MSEQSGEEVLRNQENEAVSQAVGEWFQRDPYIHAVYNAMPYDDRARVIEKITADATEHGFMRADAPRWLAYHVNQMYDDGKLPEIANAQLALQQHFQAQEDHAIQNAPIKEVEKYLRQNYREPAPRNVLAESGGEWKSGGQRTWPNQLVFGDRKGK